MATDDQSTILGVVILARHGDRQGFYQDPDTYTASATAITPLGEQQEFALGGLIRQRYFNVTSRNFIQGISEMHALVQQAQVQLRADAGGEGGVIFDSAVAAAQGMWPPNALSNVRLSNGSTVVSPLGGYQYIPIESVEPNNDVSLEGYTSCNTFDNHTAAFYASEMFQQKASQYSQFLTSLIPHMDGRPVTLENMWNVFDYMNVQAIHNRTFLENLPANSLVQARDLANWHEYNVFSDDAFDGIGNIAFRTMIPSVTTAMQRIANASDPLKLHFSAIAYKPFLSLFNMTGVSLPPAIVNYAASVALEIHQPASSSVPFVRFTFKNGTDDADYAAHTMHFAGWDGSADTDVPLPTFLAAFAPAGINTTLQWCNACGQTQARGCAALFAGNGTGVQAAGAGAMGAAREARISPVGAGFLGAGLAVVVLGAMLGVLAFLGLLTVGRRSGRSARRKGEDGSESHSSTNSIAKLPL